MKILNLLMWVGQFGLSILFPTVFFLLAGFSSFRTAKVCLHSLCKAAEEMSDRKKPPVGFNQHQ